MKRILLINPNTTPGVTELMVERLTETMERGLAGHGAAAGVEIEAQTAAFGAPYISCETSHAVAAHATLHAWARAWPPQPLPEPLQDCRPPHDAVLIGCFGDPGLFALRDCSPVPVTGLAEASFILAAQQGPFAVVTGGLRWRPMLQRLADSLGFGAELVHIETVVPTGAELRADPELARRVLTDGCHHAARSGARSVIVGGAGLAGLAQALQPQCSLPLIDSVQAGLQVLLQGAAPEPVAASTDVWERLELVRSCTPLGRG